MRSLPGWVAVCGLLWACGSGDQDPRDFLPEDGEVLISFAPVVQAQEEAGRFFARVPEADGILEWLRSLVGIDLRSVARTREEGWDPARPWGVAWRAGEWWIALPVDSQEKVRRRLGLRLARLGMVSRPASGTGSTYEDLRDPNRRAWTSVERDVVRICISYRGGCRGESGKSPVPGSIPARIEAVAREVGLVRPAVVFHIVGGARNRLLPQVWRSRWPKGFAGQVAWAAVGEIRGAIRWVPRPVLRVLVGTQGEPVDAVGPIPALAEREMAALGMDLAPWMDLLRRSAGDVGLPGDIGSLVQGPWDGRLRLSVGEAAHGARNASWRDRFSFGLRLGLRPDRESFGQIGPADPAGIEEGSQVLVHLPFLGPLRGQVSASEIHLAPTAREPTRFSTDSLDLRPGLVAWMRVDWQRVVRSLGGDALGLPGHLAAVIREIQGRVVLLGGRAVIEIGLTGWEDGTP